MDVDVEKLRRLVRVPTVSSTVEDEIDHGAFDDFLAALAEEFPLVHERLEVTRVRQHSLLLRWPGRDASSAPVVLMAHLDVVPVDPDAPWQHPPFGAEVHDGKVWGRGTLDDKGSLVALCVAVERALEQDVVPARDVWLSFGAREEVSGADAAEAVEVLRGRGVEPWFVLDEGGAVAAEAFPGVRPPLGVVGVSEKGTTTLELRAEGRGGHSSTPAPGGPTARIARAVVRLERRPFATRLPEPTLELFARIAPHAPRPLRPLLASARRLQPLVARALVAAGPEPAALARTTMAVTQLSGSPAHNVIASSATAVLNLRILVGDTVASATAHVRRAVADDSVAVTVLEANEPSPVSPVDDDAFRLLEQVVGDHFPEAVVTPYVMMAATDSRFFAAICPRVYRFTPFRMSRAQRESIHSYDEHVGVQDWLDGVEWYADLLRRLDEPAATTGTPA
ncbi:carboxypeptidase PM20D1 [Nocardioides scoriae]|uniref:Carboxypeptidase PM20D1 n=1 Tax=Nocardioides scoriae TaxID=642780 RepID=A0A1H1WJF4_9ACTN|nr:M20/M25/M40 family metallo-hydrolase [Nocardioides scoriae]SDS96319.1 carboxypeptidase PM20D1 [Nocardioides scoriae]